MKMSMKGVVKKVCGTAISILCAPLAPLVIAYYSIYVRVSKKMQNNSDNRKPSKAKTILSLLAHLVAISALNTPLAVAVCMKTKGKLVSHIFALYVTLGFIAACELGSLKCRFPASSR